MIGTSGRWLSRNFTAEWGVPKESGSNTAYHWSWGQMKMKSSGIHIIRGIVGGSLQIFQAHTRLTWTSQARPNTVVLTL